MNAQSDEKLHSGHRKRLKEQFAQDCGKTMSDFTFLELMLFYAVPQGDTNPLAHRLIDRFGSFDKVLEATKEELLEVSGIGEHAASFLTTLLPTFSRYLERRSGEKFEYTDLDKIREYLTGKYLNADTEKAMLLNFDSKGVFINSVYLGSGDMSSIEINNRELASAIVRDKAVYSILVHNHPSGIASPSTGDLSSVESISAFLKMLSVTLVDNIIITADDFLAFSQNSRYIKYLY